MGAAISLPRFHESRRASVRITMSVPIVLGGLDSTGSSFIEKTHTVVINRRGAKALTKHSLILGGRLRVAVLHLKRASSATVAWLGADQGEYQEIGIDLGQAGDFWGVPLPEDTLASRGTVTAMEQNTDSAAPKSDAGPGPELPRPVMGPATPSPRPSASPPEVHTETSDKLLSALRVTHAAIEESLGEALRQLNRQAEESLNEMQRVTIEQAREHLHRVIEDAGREFESRVIQVVAHNQQVCEQTLQRLVQAAQERLEAYLADCQASLAAHAETVRRELARTLADLSGTLGRD